MRAWSGFGMDEWAELIEDLRTVRDGTPRPWTLTCRRPGCPGLMQRGKCLRCGGRR